MRVQVIATAFALGFLSACVAAREPANEAITRVERDNPTEAELTTLITETSRIAETLDIPGFAFGLDLGTSWGARGAVGQTRNGIPFTENTELRFASVTKALSGIALMQLVEDGALSLDDPLSQWDESFEGPATITVGQVAAHISEGNPGTQYVYSSGRFARLQAVIEGASGMLLATYFCERILMPSRAACLDSPALGAHAGLVSNVGGMSKVFEALLAGELVSNASLQRLMTPTALLDGGHSPVSVGFFVTEVTGEKVLWSFGQDDPEHSGVRVILWPERQSSFVYLANSNAISDAYRLLGGDIRTDALFHAAVAIVQDPDVIEEEWTAQARWLTSIYKRDIDSVIETFETLDVGLSYAENPALTYASSIMCQIDSGFGDAVLPILVEAVRDNPSDPWSLLFAAEAHESCGHPSEAATYFTQLRDLTNQEDDLLHRLRVAWANGGLARLSLCTDPEAAAAFARAGLDTGVPGQTRQGLLDLLEQATGEGPSRCS